MSPGWAAVVTSTDKSMPAAPANSGGCGCSDADAPQLSRMLDLLIDPVQTPEPHADGSTSRRLCLLLRERYPHIDSRMVDMLCYTTALRPTSSATSARFSDRAGGQRQVPHPPLRDKVAKGRAWSSLILFALALCTVETGCSFTDEGFQDDFTAVGTGTGCVSVSSKLIAHTVFADPQCYSGVLLRADDCQDYFACSFHRDAPIGVCARDRTCPAD